MRGLLKKTWHRGKDRSAPDHWVYVLEDRLGMTKSFFKISYTTRTPSVRANEEALRVRRRGMLFRSLSFREVAKWRFKTSDVAQALEEWFIYAVNRLGYQKIDDADWFGMDREGMSKMVAEFGKIAEAISAAEGYIAVTGLAEAVGRTLKAQKMESAWRSGSQNRRNASGECNVPAQL